MKNFINLLKYILVFGVFVHVSTRSQADKRDSSIEKGEGLTSCKSLLDPKSGREKPFWEDIIEATLHKPEYGRRIYEDGSFFECTSEIIQIDKKRLKVKTIPRPLGWYLVTHLSPQKVKEVKQAILQSGFFDFTPPISVPQVSDGRTWVIKAQIEQKLHSVQILGYPHNQPKFLNDLLNIIAQATAR